jgi:Tol biopolymer transport system component
MTTIRCAHDAPRATTRITAAGAAAALGALLALASPGAAQFAGRPSLMNVSGAGVPANSGSGSVAVSADGTIVAFASDGDNLVPLDTNGDTDVFLHDTVSRITRRVSVNYQGEEAMGDSDCPSLSADGRRIAFRSRAWNMRQNGENIGTPMWEVYVHDRQGPETIRVSAPLEGGAATANSGCPRISADGLHVAYWSEAADLVPDDTNGFADVFVYDLVNGSHVRASVADDGAQADGFSDQPAISADGSVVAFRSYARNLTPLLAGFDTQVYARDLSAGTTEMVSRALEAPPILIPYGESESPEISADGNLVLFLSSVSNLTSYSWASRPLRLFLRNRTTGVVEGVEPVSAFPGPCSHWDSEVCDKTHTDGAALSADGRFIAFLSGSFQLLPENPLLRQEQIYLFDRQTRRLRRLSVDPTGYPVSTHFCGGSSSDLALSADGRVLAFVGDNAASLGLPLQNHVARDVVRLAWTCDPNGHCRTPSLCPGTPVSNCQAAESSRLRIRRNPPLAPRRERFSWRWVGAGNAQGQPFVDPAEGSYHLCVYTGETLNAQVDAGIPSSASWRRIQNGWQHQKRGEALERVSLRSSSGRATATVLSTSAVLDLPYLPFDARNGVTVQLLESTSGRCWEAAFPASAVRTNTRGSVTSEGSTPGLVHATTD